MVSPTSPVPLYRQVADLVQARIDAGELVPGDPVPSEADLVAAYGVARGTARKAIEVLRERGLVTTEQGKGTYVGPAGTPRRPRSRDRYAAIAVDLEERVTAGEWRPDAPLPSEVHLGDHYDVSVSTIRRAIRVLRDRGLLMTVPGKGTYVTGSDRPA
ncbi:GntR family transcriptional regulator [Nonomuraea sp. NPDC050663]|uniref:GntR family transcriptional regulator n=1 Tax=Nonomuraea sp. NPDC050663 TaxID=3364370 RepID=UPI003792EAC0